jgi:hypothetical protein
MRVVKSGLTFGLMVGLVMANVTPITNAAAASPEAGGAAVRQDASGSTAPTGILTGGGSITVNGNSVQSGATIFTNSKIVTGSDGNATIDLQSLGRVEIRPNSTVMLVFSPTLVDVRLEDCGEVTHFVPATVQGRVTVNEDESTVRVASGQVSVKADGEDAKTLSGGQSEEFDSRIVAVASGETTFTANVTDECDDDGGAIIAGLGAGAITAVLLAVGGAVTGVALAVTNDDDSETLPGVSTFQP